MNEIFSSLIYALSGKQIPWSFRSVSVTANSMEQNPSWAAERSSASQEFPCTLWNRKVHCRIHKCLPHATAIQCILPIPLFKIHFKIILPSIPLSSKGYILIRFSHQNPLCNSSVPHQCHMPLLSHPSCFDHVNIIRCRFQIITLLVM